MRNLAKVSADLSAEPPNSGASTYEPRTPLGRKLMALRKEIVHSGGPLLNWEDLDREIAQRRGERSP